jgi:hypothetical protein
LMHADAHLTSGTWRFEKISDDVYNEWKAKYDCAEQEDSPKPPTPYIPMPGTEFKKVQACELTEKASRKRKPGPARGKVALKGKSRPVIDESDEDIEPELSDGEGDVNSTGSNDE